MTVVAVGIPSVLRTGENLSLVDAEEPLHNLLGVWIGNLAGIVKSFDNNRPSWLKEPKGIVCNCLLVFYMLEDVGEVDNVERGVGGVVALSGSLSP